jgi:DNA-binding CsgD family transcriptional regulator
VAKLPADRALPVNLSHVVEHGAVRVAGPFSRPAALTPEQRRHAKLLRAGGVSPDEIAQSLGCSRATVYRALAETAA